MMWEVDGHSDHSGHSVQFIQVDGHSGHSGQVIHGHSVHSG